MRIGIVSEGHSDRAVIKTLVLRASNLDISDIIAIKPEYKLDATDKAAPDKQTFSNWDQVKKECQEKELIGQFLSLEGHDYVVVHIDTAEADLYGVKRPDKNSSTYCLDLRKSLIEMIKFWLNGEYVDQVLFAVAIEEIEAWLLSIYTGIADTTKPVDAKKKLHHELGKKNIDSTNDEDNFLKLSKPFVKLKNKEFEKILSTNCSLKEFYSELCDHLPHK